MIFFCFFFLSCARPRFIPEKKEEWFVLTHDTWFKESPDESSQLSQSQKCFFKKGGRFFAQKILAQEEKNHFFVHLGSALPDCKFQKGYVYAQHMSLESKGKNHVFKHESDALRLAIPYYYYQWHNEKSPPEASCGITSAAMLLSFVLGKKVHPDEIFARYGSHRQGQTPEGLAQIYRDFGAKQAGSSREGTFEKIKSYLEDQSPVVVHGYFTAGHIILIMGFDKKKGFLVYDPAGEWTGEVYGGYPNAPHEPNIGKGLLYSYEEMQPAIAPDHRIWMSWAKKH